MEFNDITNEQGLYQDALYLSGANSATFNIKDFTRLANFAQNRVTSKILKNDNRWKHSDSNNPDRDIATADLVANQPDYSMLVSHLKIKRVRMKDSNGNLVTLTPIDRRDLSDDTLNSYGTPEYYDKDGRSILPFPVPNYSSTGNSGIEIEFQRGPVYFISTDTTKKPGFATPYHRLVSLYCAQDWLLSHATRQNPLTHRINLVNNLIKELEFDLEDHYLNRDVDDAPKLKIRSSIGRVSRMM